MIDIANRHIVRAGKQMPIIRWEVWHLTPWGITPSIEEAVEKCIKNDVEADFNIIPTPVAIAESNEWEMYTRFR